MASAQRDHWSYVVLHSLLLSLVLCRKGTFADKNKYYHTSTLCVRERYHPLYKKIDGAVLTSESEDNLDCVITFQTDSILQKFMLRFERLALDCYDHLYIFDGAHAFGNHRADLSCRSTRADFGTIYTQSNYVTLKYVTDGRSPPGNGFQLIITAIRESPVGCRDFHCMNDHCIPQDLKCDEVNHCGDNSDETAHAQCIDESQGGRILGIGVTVFISGVITIVLSFFISAVGITICLCRRRHSRGSRSGAPGGGPVVSGNHATPQQDGGFLHGASSHPALAPGQSPYPSQSRFGGGGDRLGEKPPPYPGGGGGGMYHPTGTIGYDSPQENFYYPTK